jgi:hypothetical protein
MASGSTQSCMPFPHRTVTVAVLPMHCPVAAMLFSLTVVHSVGAVETILCVRARFGTCMCSPFMHVLCLHVEGVHLR